MKIRTSIHAGRNNCSPEAQHFMQRAIAMENQIARCLANRAQNPDPIASPINPPAVGSGYIFPDRSGWCG